MAKTKLSSHTQHQSHTHTNTHASRQQRECTADGSRGRAPLNRVQSTRLETQKKKLKKNYFQKPERTSENTAQKAERRNTISRLRRMFSQN